MIVGASAYYECHPVDGDTDPLAAQAAKFVLDTELRNPRKLYEEYLHRVVYGALAARQWGMAVEFDPACGIDGETCFRVVDPTNLLTCPGYLSPHDLRCPWIIEQRIMRMSDLDRMAGAGWDKGAVKAITPDGGWGGEESRGDPSDFPGQVRLVPDSFPRGDLSGKGDPLVTMLFCWYRYDPEEKKNERSLGYSALAPEERYMACASCGYTEHVADGTMLPASAPCPQCGQMMERIDSKENIEAARAYPDGRLCIVAPASKQLAYDGAWPQKMRSFPFMLYNAYPSPRDLVGQSDTMLNWGLINIENATLRMVYDQLRLGPPLLVAPYGQDALVDSDGQPFQFTDEAGRIAYVKNQVSKSLLERFPGQDVQPAVFQFLNVIGGIVSGNLGMADLQLTPERSRDIAASTVEQLIKSGEIPTDQHVRDLRRQLSIFLGIVVDIARQTWTRRRWIRAHNAQGAVEFQMLQGADIPDVDVIVTAEPEMKQMDAEKFGNLQQLFQMPPPYRRIAGRYLGVAPSDLDAMEKADAEMKPAPPGPVNGNGSRPQVAAALAGASGSPTMPRM